MTERVRSSARWRWSHPTPCYNRAMSNVQAIFFGVFAVALVFTNEFALRIATMRHGSEFTTYAVLINLRPRIYAMSFGAFCGVAIFGGPSNAFVAAVMVILASYVIAGRAYMAR